MSIVVFGVLCIAALLIFMAGLMGSDIDLYGPAAVTLIMGLICMAIAMWMAVGMDEYGEYYLPCEIVATNETSTYFGTVDQDHQQIYAVETGNRIWPDDVPYLLHMDGKETKTVTDDEVMMVWRAD